MTTQQTTRVIPAGWYQDPADEGKVRWWNGMTWTEHVELKPEGSNLPAADPHAIDAPSTPISAEERDAEARELERQYLMSLTAPGDSADHRGPETGSISLEGHHIPRKTHAKPGTASAWFLAFIPLVANALTVIAGYIFFYVTPTPLVAITGLVLFGIQFLWAVGDARALQSRGLKAPNPMLALALPILGALLYLIARRRLIEGSTLVIVFFAMLILAVGLPATLAASGNAATFTKALEVQQAVRADMVDSGKATSVTCPPVLDSVKPGTIFTCDAVLVSGNNAHVWVSIDNDAGDFSWALAKR